MAAPQARGLALCTIDPDFLKQYRKFRFRREENKAALIVKIDPKERVILLDYATEDETIEEIVEELPAQVPRYIIYTFTHHYSGGRKTVPLILINLSPSGAKPELHMLYASSMSHLVAELGIGKVLEARSTSEITQEWIDEKMKFFDAN